MRQETIIKTYVTFEELNKNQQKKILDSHRYINVDYIWWDYTEQDFHIILENLGYRQIESNFTGFYSQGDGASFKAIFDIPMNITELDDRLENLEAYAPKYLDDDLKEMFLNLNFSEELNDNEDQLEIYRNGRYCHEFTMSCYNESLLEFSRELAKIYYNTLNNDYDYLMSDKAITETIICNEYEFDLDTLRTV